MENFDSASDEIKSLALDGKFTEIENNFGKKMCGKAENYVEVMLASLNEKQQQILPLDGIAYATPFMIFAAKSTCADVRAVAAAFEMCKTSPGESQQSASTDLSSKDAVLSRTNTLNVSSMSKDDDGEKEASGTRPPAVVVAPILIPSTVSKPAIVRALRLAAARTNIAADEENEESAKRVQHRAKVARSELRSLLQKEADKLRVPTQELRGLWDGHRELPRDPEVTLRELRAGRITLYAAQYGGGDNPDTAGDTKATRQVEQQSQSNESATVNMAAASAATAQSEPEAQQDRTAEWLAEGIDGAAAVDFEASALWTSIQRGLASESTEEVCAALQQVIKLLQPGQPQWFEPYKLILLKLILPHCACPDTVDLASGVAALIADRASDLITQVFVNLVLEGLQFTDAEAVQGAVQLFCTLLEFRAHHPAVQNKLAAIVASLVALTANPAVASAPVLRRAFDAIIQAASAPSSDTSLALHKVIAVYFDPTTHALQQHAVVALGALGFTDGVPVPVSVLSIVLPMLLEVAQRSTASIQAGARDVLLKILAGLTDTTVAAVHGEAIAKALYYTSAAQDAMQRIAALAAQGRNAEATAAKGLTIFAHIYFGIPFGMSDAYKLAVTELMPLLKIAPDDEAKLRCVAYSITLLMHTGVMGYEVWLGMLLPLLSLIPKPSAVSTERLVEVIYERMCVLLATFTQELSNSFTSEDERLTAILTCRTHAQLLPVPADDLRGVLCDAAEAGLNAAVTFLVNSTANPSLALLNGALVRAVEHGQELVAETLLAKKADAGQTSKDGTSLLELSVTGSHMTMMKLLTNALLKSEKPAEISETVREKYPKMGERLDGLVKKFDQAAEAQRHKEAHKQDQATNKFGGKAITTELQPGLPDEETPRQSSHSSGAQVTSRKRRAGAVTEISGEGGDVVLVQAADLEVPADAAGASKRPRAGRIGSGVTTQTSANDAKAITTTEIVPSYPAGIATAVVTKKAVKEKETQHKASAAPKPPAPPALTSGTKGNAADKLKDSKKKATKHQQEHHRGEGSADEGTAPAEEEPSVWAAVQDDNPYYHENSCSRGRKSATQDTLSRDSLGGKPRALATRPDRKSIEKGPANPVHMTEKATALAEIRKAEREVEDNFRKSMDAVSAASSTGTNLRSGSAGRQRASSPNSRSSSPIKPASAPGKRSNSPTSRSDSPNKQVKMSQAASQGSSADEERHRSPEGPKRQVVKKPAVQSAGQPSAKVASSAAGAARSATPGKAAVTATGASSKTAQSLPASQDPAPSAPGTAPPARSSSRGHGSKRTSSEAGLAEAAAADAAAKKAGKGGNAKK